MYETGKSVYVFRVDCMHFLLFLDTFRLYTCPLAANFLRKSIGYKNEYIFIYINAPYKSTAYFDRLRDRKFSPILLI